MQNNLTGKDAYEAQKAEKLKVKTFTNKQKINRVFRWMLVGALLLATFYGLYWLMAQPRVSGDPTVVAQIKENDIVLGNPDAPVKLIEYSDFQCPACQSYFPVVKEALVQVGSDVAFVYRHYPLPQHRNASLAALAAEAAGRQGAFWEMHDMLFINQADWSDLSATEAKDMFISYAMSLDLEPEAFFADLSNEEIKSKITSNIAEGKAAGVTGTPSFFINGEKIINPRGVEDLVSLLEEELKRVEESKEVVETTEQSN